MSVNPNHPKDISLYLRSWVTDGYFSDGKGWDGFDDVIQTAFEKQYEDGQWGGDFYRQDEKDWIISDFKWEPSQNLTSSLQTVFLPSHTQIVKIP